MKTIFFLLALVTSAHAATSTYVLAIGNNDPPAGDAELAPLRYADDDAAAVYSFGRELGATARLLAVLDADTQRRFPELANVARPPSLAVLRNEIAWLAVQLANDRQRGLDPIVIVFFSGHGRRPPGEPASLVMRDGELTTQVLYDEVLGKLPAKYVHLIVDACHAEAVLRPRDADAAPVRLTNDDVRSYLEHTTLQRFPHVGALAATTANAQAHEWDTYQQGIFTHEVLSGLRGAADINHDGRIEYSELEAFLAAANRNVDDQRARLDVVAHPPLLDARASIVDLREAVHAPRISGQVAVIGPLRIEDARGRRLVDVRAEKGFRVTLVVPTGTLYLHGSSREAKVEAQLDARIELAHVAFGPPTMAARGAMEASLYRGLFASEFGPSYYRGFVDHNRELVAVPLATPIDGFDAQLPTPSRKPAWAMVGVASALAVVTAVLGGFALDARSDFDHTTLQRAATQDATRFDRYQGAAYGTLAVGAVAAGVMTWLLLRSSPKFFSTHFAHTP